MLRATGRPVCTAVCSASASACRSLTLTRLGVVGSGIGRGMGMGRSARRSPVSPAYADGWGDDSSDSAAGAAPPVFPAATATAAESESIVSLGVGTGTGAGVGAGTGGGKHKVARSSVPLLTRLMTLRAEDKHDEVIDIWKSLRKGHKGGAGKANKVVKLNSRVLCTLVASAIDRGDSAFVLETVEGAVQQGVLPEQGTLLSFMKTCAAAATANGSGSASDSADGSGGGAGNGWTRAVRMLEKMKGNNALNSPIFEEVATICFSCGRWRRALDVLNQMHERGLPLSAKMQNSALEACAAVVDRVALTAAYQLFKHAVAERTPVLPRAYAALISGFAEAGMHLEADAVWSHLQYSGLPVTDSICAARISQLGHSGHADRAAEVVNLSMDLPSRASNRQSINNMTNVLLKAGRIEDACAYLQTMKGLKKVKLTPQLVEYHVKALAQGGHIHAAINFLEYWKVLWGDALAAGHESATISFEKTALVRIWQELFKDCIYLGKISGAELCYRHAISSSNAELGIDTTGWLSRLFSELGEAEQGKYLMHLVKAPALAAGQAESATIFAIVRAMCLCRLFTEAVDFHQVAVLDAQPRRAPPDPGAGHLLVEMLCRHDMWREARMVSACMCMRVCVCVYVCVCMCVCVSMSECVYEIYFLDIYFVLIYSILSLILTTLTLTLTYSGDQIPARAVREQRRLSARAVHKHRSDRGPHRQGQRRGGGDVAPAAAACMPTHLELCQVSLPTIA
jgi:pentatricopeptide repeat protein